MNLVPRQGGNRFSGIVLRQRRQRSTSRATTSPTRSRASGLARAERAVEDLGHRAAPSAGRLSATACGSFRPSRYQGNHRPSRHVQNATRATSTPGTTCRRALSRRRRQHVEERQRAAHAAGQPQQQVQLLLGRTATLHVVRQTAATRQRRRKLAATTIAASRAAGHVDLARDEPALARGWCGKQPDRRVRLQPNISNFAKMIPVQELCTAGCANNGGIPGLAIARTRAEARRISPTAMCYSWRAAAILRHRPAQREGRLHRTVHR